ncbi:remorin family protein [Populus alba x Populus x berolinensis]|nr:remorin family protein [Populus alba x Populus x berolinensis]
MKQNLISSQSSLCALPSPGGAKYHDNKGWSSERVPHPSSGSRRRHVSALTTKSSRCHPLRRAKSKSGPINVHPEIGYYQNCSPSMGVLDGGIVRNFMVNSPFSTGVSMANGAGSHYGGSGARNTGKGHVGTFG